MPRSRSCLVVRCSSAMPLYPCGGILDPWRYPCGSAAARSARFLRTSAVAPVPAALLRFSGRAAARSARCPRPGAVAPLPEAPMCLRSPPPAHRRCSRHGTVAPLLGARRPVPQCRSRRRALRSPVTDALLIAVALTEGALRLSSVPLCPAEAPVPAPALYLSLTAAPPIAVAHAAEPLHSSSVPRRPLQQRPSRRCHRPPLISRPPITVALFVELLRPSSIPFWPVPQSGHGGGAVAPPPHYSPHPSPFSSSRDRGTLPLHPPPGAAGPVPAAALHLPLTGAAPDRSTRRETAASSHPAPLRSITAAHLCPRSLRALALAVEPSKIPAVLPSRLSPLFPEKSRQLHSAKPRIVQPSPFPVQP